MNPLPPDLHGMPAPRLAEAQAFELGQPERYTGRVAVARLVAAQDDSLRIYEVRFGAGARTVWHAHAGHQWLVGLVGSWVVQLAGGAVKCLGPGEAAHVPAGVRHWHGATEETGASHLALNFVGTTTWEAPLSAEEYAAALAQP